MRDNGFAQRVFGARFGCRCCVDELFKNARAEDRKESREAYAFDAFIELADRASGERTTKKTSPRFMALIRADIEALQRGSVEGDEICEIAGLGPIPATVARDLLGDAILKLVLTKGVDVAKASLRLSHRSAQGIRLGGRYEGHVWETEVEGCGGGGDLLPHFVGSLRCGAGCAAPGGVVPRTGRRPGVAGW